MISVLIPVYNRDVNELVCSLSQQVEVSGKDMEIVVMDDGSDANFKNLNHKLASIPFVRYIDAGKNYGRIRIRQLLANIASYKWLLFLDCDSKIISDHFLETYYQQDSDSVAATVGGRVYTSTIPADCRCMLHWLYGSQREVTQFDNNHGHTNRFMTNNLFIQKSTFQQFEFNEEWVGYGYEDTWMGIQLELMKVPVVFINNPVLHDGVENSDVFLKKSMEALKNLNLLSKVIPPWLLIKHVRLFGYYSKLRSRRILWMVSLTCFVFQRSLQNNLRSCKPSLKLFDLYRLHLFVKVTRTTRP